MVGAMRRLLVTTATLGMALAPSLARADEIEALHFLPGAAREIPRTTSASRDSAVLEYAYGPKPQGSLGAEFGVLHKQWRQMSLRTGAYAMVTLENDTDPIIFPREYWRGLVGISLTFSPDALAEAWFGQGAALELGVVFGHESTHHTDSELELDTAAYAAYGQLNFWTHDLGLRVPMSSYGHVAIRFADRLFAGTAYSHAPSFDLHVRFTPLSWLHPVISVFGEQLIDEGDGPNCYFCRVMTGPAFVGVFGEILPFFSADAGCRKGLLWETRGGFLSGGLRYAPF